ncbi:MAG: FAD-dependent oxidoreductase [Sulfuricaulis sp.]
MADFDVVVIGGGIHGSGVAQAASAAGHSVLLLEQQSIGHGTSSRSSKLIHGGLRYLESARFGLVRESLREREILLRIAPALVRRVPFYIPIYATTRRRPWMMRAGLALYALLGGLQRHTGFDSLPRRQWNDLDGLDNRGLQAVFRYQDAQTDDIALTQAVMRSAEKLGAVLGCPANFLSAQRVHDGFRVEYQENTRVRSCHTRTLVNAAGPWANAVLNRIVPCPSILPVDLLQGAHIILDGAIHRGVYYMNAPDGRAVFAMPWKGHTLVGTTETLYTGDPAAVGARPEEITYLQEVWRRYFPHRSERLLDSFAGLRVLRRQSGVAFYHSRETVLHPDDPSRTRLVTIYGGKLTGYRATAAKVMRQLAPSLPSQTLVADTAEIILTPD